MNTDDETVDTMKDRYEECKEEAILLCDAHIKQVNTLIEQYKAIDATLGVLVADSSFPVCLTNKLVDILFAIMDKHDVATVIRTREEEKVASLL